MKSLALLLFAASVACAQSPNLDELVSREAGPLWFGYKVDSNQTGYNSCWGGLEGGQGRVVYNSQEPVKLEGPRTMLVVYRVENHAVQKIRIYPENCTLDSGGLRLVWLTGVSTEASIRFLTAQVARDNDGALAAIAMHAGTAADETLERFAAPPNGEHLQEKALFWLASARGERGFRTVERVARHDPSDQLREKTMFDLSLCQPPAAIDALIDSAKHDSSSRVREQALFWLAQKAGAKAAGEIKNSIDNDPNTEVKKKAVFALQQLPEGEGVPLLIQVAKTNSNPEVRKQAMFWLGQCHDPRALSFFQEVLAR